MASGMWIPNLINLLIGYITIMFWYILSPLLGLFGLWATVNQSVVAAVAAAAPSKINQKLINGALKLPK